MGSGGVKETLQGLIPMAREMNLDQDGFDAVLREAAAHYQRDRGAALVREAFADL